MNLTVGVKIPVTLADQTGFREMIKQAGADALRYYHKYHLHRHFKPGNDIRYNHAPRNPRYIIKRSNYGKKMGITTCDMVLTGRMQKAMMGKTPRISYTGSNQHSANVSVNYDIPHMVSDSVLEELARRSPTEVQGMQRVIEEAIADFYLRNS